MPRRAAPALVREGRSPAGRPPPGRRPLGLPARAHGLSPPHGAPAMTAIRHNPVVRTLAQRLERRGKPRLVIICAAIRKLIHLAYGVLKHRTPFDPNWHSSAAPPT